MTEKLPKLIFDNLWRARLSNYPQTAEFRTVYQELKEELPFPDRKLITPVIVSLIGIPGSGKTRFSQLLQEFIPAVHLSSDAIAFSRLPQGHRDDYYKAYVIQEALARDYVQEGYSVIMDDNNRTRYNREQVYRLANRHRAHNLLFWLNISLEAAIPRVQRRNLEEGGVVEPESIDTIRRSLEQFQDQIEEPTGEEIQAFNVLFKPIDATLPIEQIRQGLQNDKELGALLK